jgi:DNA-binding CsgD family transcriptional regulator
MKYLSIISISSAALYFYLAITVFLEKPRETAHWLLAGSAFALAFWTFFACFTYNAESIEQVRLFFYLSVSGLFLFLPLQNFFVRYMTGKLSLGYILLFGLPALFLLVKNVEGAVTFSGFFRENGRWVFIPARATVWNILWIGYFITAFGTGIMYCINWYKRTELQREKQQIKLLGISASVAMVLLFTDYVLHNHMFAIRRVSLTPVLLIPWAIGYVIAIKRYRLLNVTPEMVTRRILESINELIILVDPEGKPRYMNQKALDFFGKPFRKIAGVRIDQMFLQNNTTESLVPTDRQQGPLKKRVALHMPEGGELWPVLDLEITRVFDRFNDPLGFLLIGREAGALNNLLTETRLTEREIDVAGCIVNGWKTTNIAEHLRIAERTVKSHISHIYRKLNISNRIELLSFIEER